MKRRFTVEDGYIISREPGKHKSHLDTTRKFGVVVQLWPFSYTRVPKWETDITNSFDITEINGKHVTIEGNMPDTGEVFVTVHIDYQISASAPCDQVEMFIDFECAFADTVYFSKQGVRLKFRVSFFQGIT